LECNQVVLSGDLIECDPLRYTPAGIAVTEFKLRHASEQLEAGKMRQVECDISAVALAEVARAIAKLDPDSRLKLRGFLAKKSRMSTHLVLHVNHFELIG